MTFELRVESKIIVPVDVAVVFRETNRLGHQFMDIVVLYRPRNSRAKSITELEKTLNAKTICDDPIEKGSSLRKIVSC